MKYMGGKSRIANELKDIIETIMKENNINVYVEPFVGGCNVVDKIDAPTKIAGDENKYLIGMWSALRDGWLPPEDISKEEYDKIRANKDEYPPELVAVAGFCASFNGRWFSGHYSGSAEVEADGSIRNYYKSTVKGMIAHKETIQGIDFRAGSYTQFSNVEGALIYCDPPYASTTGYMDNGFDNSAFWDWVRVMSKKNIVLVSEYTGTNGVKSIYKKELEVNFRGAQSKVIEQLFTFNSTPYIDSLEQKYDEYRHNHRLSDYMI